MSKQRIILIDNHIVAQWHDGIRWYTGGKSYQNAEEGFAIWTFSESNVATASRLYPTASVLRSALKPVQRRDRWFAYASDPTPKDTYGEALRSLASEIV